MQTEDYQKPAETPRVLAMPVRVDLPETAETIAAAMIQNRKERAEAIAEPDDPDRSIDARLMITAFVEEFGGERVHRWARSAALIRSGICPCVSIERDVR